ncbi:MAG: hypothetical protein IKH54_01300 [Bacilli bacterium]|nr:hypothetical protein [Bacilli bacterium]
MSFIKKYYKFVLFFFFLCFINYFLIYSDYSYDTIWEYGMSHAFVLGQLPYKDFTLVTTPLFIFLFSIGLFIKDNLFVFLLESIISYMIMYYFLDKLLGKNRIIFLLVLCLFLFKSFIPTYNSLCLVFIVILMYLEKNKSNDYLIGLLLGLLILTKHTIGLSIMFFSFIGIRNIKKISKRLIGLSIPLLLFLIYLLITNSLFQFIDLTLLGLFDFKNSNKLLISYVFVLSLILLLINIIFMLKNKKEILFFYVLGSFSFIMPICDLNHFTFLISIFIIPIIYVYNDNINLKLAPYILLVLITILNIGVRFEAYSNIHLNPFNHFDMTVINRDYDKIHSNILNEMKKYDNMIIISDSGSFYSIILDKKFNYFTIPHRGNYGYNGLSKMKKRFNDLTDTYMFLDRGFYDRVIFDTNNGLDTGIAKSQFDTELYDYIVDNSKYVSSIEGFDIYYKE